MTLPTRSNSDKIQASWFNDIKTEIETTTTAITGMTSDDLSIGDGTNTDKTITADNGDANEPQLRYNASGNAWEFSNDGSTYTEMAGSTSTPPTVQTFTTGSGTYTTPSGVSYIRVRAVAGGGGGSGGGGAGAVTGLIGGATTFGTSLLTCNPGTSSGQGAIEASGGTATVSSPAVGIAQRGGNSTGIQTGSATAQGGSGGLSPFGGNGAGSWSTGAAGAALANSGSGGGGGGATASANTGQSGSAGGYVDAIITSPSSTYSYAIGAGGGGGGAGANGGNGAAGGSGFIIVEEYY